LLAALILVAAVANLNLAVSDVAVPDIGQAFDDISQRAGRHHVRLTGDPVPEPSGQGRAR
jgi:hypothetical protein